MTKKKFVVTVRALDGKAPPHEIDVSAQVGSSNYPKVLQGLLRKVDLERFTVDSDDADAEHDRRRKERGQ